LDVVDFVDGVLTTQGSRWSVGVAGDVVVLGDWDCDGEKTAALLRPTSGTVYVFDAWAAPEQALSPSTRQDVPGAADLRAIDQEGDGCDELEVVHSSGESTTVLIHGAAG
jgi:hypothetical protein